MIDLITAVSLLVSSVASLIAVLKHRESKTNQEGLEALVRAIEEANAKRAKRLVAKMMKDGTLTPRAIQYINEAIRRIEHGKDAAEKAGNPDA